MRTEATRAVSRGWTDHARSMQAAFEDEVHNADLVLLFLEIVTCTRLRRPGWSHGSSCRAGTRASRQPTRGRWTKKISGAGCGRRESAGGRCVRAWSILAGRFNERCSIHFQASVRSRTTNSFRCPLAWLSKVVEPPYPAPWFSLLRSAFAAEPTKPWVWLPF